MGADLTRARLFAANLSSADLTDACLEYAQMSLVNLVDAILVRVNILGAITTDARRWK
jgi:uncharacterized protein YjbI with pentapeptide repeats